MARVFMNHVRNALFAAVLVVPSVALAAIGVNKTFNPTNVSAGQRSTLTVILINNNPAAATAAAFTDNLPGTVVIATPANASNTCGGGVIAVSGAASFSFSGGTIPAAVGLTAGQCTVQVDIVSPASGVFINTIPPNAVASSQGNNSQAASATLTVAALRPVTGAKAFTPTVLHGSTTLPAPTSRITVTLTNPNGVALTNASLTDTLPVAISIAPTPNATTTCGAGTVSTTANSATLAGGTIPANLNCNFQFDVVASNPNAYSNGAVANTIPINALVTAQGVTNTAAFSANVTLQTGARVEKTFSPTPITTGGTSTLTVTVRNFNTSPLNNVIGFTDNMPAGMTVAAPVTTGGTCLPPPATSTLAFTPAPIAGAASFTVSGGSLPGATVGVNSNANCTVTIGVTAVNAGVNPLNLTNTIPVGNFGGVAYSSAGGVLAVNQVTGITASKAFAPAAVVQGGTSVLTVTINNAAAVAASLTAVFTDSLASMGAGYTIAAAPAGATTCGGALTAVPGATSFSLPIGTTIPAAGSCTITIPVRVAANAVTGGRVNTIAQTVLQTTQGRTQFPITATLTTSAALVVAKAFAPATVAALGTSRLTVTLTHANGAPAFSGLAFTDNLPAGHTIAAVPNAVTTCGGVVTAVSGTGVFSLAGGSLAAGATSCTVAVNVTTPAGAGAATNTIPAATGATTTEGFVNAAAATATITRVVTNVTLNKSFSPATVLVGGVSRMTINVLNTGANALALTATSLTDLLPVGMVIAPVPPNPAPTNTCGGVLTATPGTSTISIANGSIAANATCAIAVSVVANASGNLINTLPAGVFTSAQSVSNPLPALATLAATGSADLQVTKTDGVVNVAPGTTTTYTIVARNNGPQPVAGAGFTDTPPAGMAFTGWTCVASAGSACGNANGSGPINELVTLLLNGTATYTVTAAIAPNAAGSITNTATIVVPGTVIDTNLANNTASDTDTLTPQADLAITKTDGVVSVVAGASTVYTIVVSNNGPSNVVGASVTDVMPAAIAGDTYTAVATGGATGFTAVGGGNINDTVNMPAGSTITYTVIANVNSGAGGNLVNTATVTAPGGVTDTNPGNNSATDSDVLTRQADLAITKTDGVVSAVPGGTTTYTVVVSNSGPSSVLGATVADVIPAAVQSATFTAIGAGGASGFTANGGGNINDVVNMPAGSSIVYTIVADIRATATGNLVNTATVTPPGGVTDPTPANNSATDTDALNAQVTLAVVKSDGSANYTPGGTAVYVVTVTNSGASDALDVTVTDLLPPGLTLTANVSCTANGNATCAPVIGSIGGTSFSMTNGVVGGGPGNSLVFTVPVAFAPGMTSNPLLNTATATDIATGSTASATDADTLMPQVSLSVAKTDGSASYTPGGTATYTVTITNGGLSNATNVTVNDPLPAGVALTANATCAPTGAANCGTVTGTTGQTVFGTAGAQITAGAGNSLVFTAPVSFAPGMATDPLDNTATALDVLSGAGGSATDSNTRAALVTLAVSKSDGSASYTPGTGATYLVGVANTGVSDALNVTVGDALPVGVTLSGAVTCAATGTANCGIVTGIAPQTSFGATGAQVSAGAGNFLTFTVPVSFAASLADNPLLNTATANDLASGANGSATDSDTLAAQADLAITKTDGVVSVAPGTTTTYTIVVTNNGPGNVVGATVTDVMPAAIASDNFTAVGSGGASGFTAAGAGNINDTLSMPAGSTVTYTVVANVSASATGNLVNTATATVPAGVTDTNPGNNSATDVDALDAQADLSITKSDGTINVAPGTATTYAIVVANNGPSDVVGATVSDILPAAIASDNFTAVGSGGASGFTAAGAGNINDTVSMQSGSTITYTVVANISAGATGNLVNTATVAPPAGVTDTNPANNSATDTDTLTATADLSITKTDGVVAIAQGGSTTYVIVVANGGPSAVVGATVSDILPAAFAVATFTAAASGGASGFTANGGGNINDTVNMPVGSTITYTVTATLNAGALGIVSNTAVVTAPASVMDPAPGNNSATDTDTITAIPTADLAITKSDGIPTYTPGSTVTYVIVASNAGPGAVLGATVIDALPVAIGGATWTCVGAGGGTCPVAGAGNINANVNLPAGGIVTFTLTGNVAAGAAGNLVNTATIAVPPGVVDPNPGNNSATDTDAPAAAAGLAITKTDGSATYAPGGTATYTITVTNNGPSNANNMSVTDNLPAGVALTGNVTCAAAGAATCGAVTGAAGGTLFTATGAMIVAGAGNRLVYALPVKFATGMATNPLVNIATASDPASVSVASASDSNAISFAGPTPPANAVPVDSRWALVLLAGLIMLATWRRSPRRNS